MSTSVRNLDVPANWDRSGLPAWTYRSEEVTEIEHALEPMTRLPAFAVHWICETRSPEALAVVCHALEFKRQLFCSLYARLHGSKPYRDFARSTAFRSAVIQYNRIQRSQACGLLAAWQAAPETVWHDAPLRLPPGDSPPLALPPPTDDDAPRRRRTHKPRPTHH